MTPTIRALNALKSMATWDMGEAAVRVADAHDVRVEWQRRSGAMTEQSQAIAQAYERAAQPGHRLHLAAVGVLSRQARASRDVQAYLSHSLKAADEALERERAGLAAHRARESALQKLIERERLREDAERAKAEAAVLDDLYLARRWVLEAGR